MSQDSGSPYPWRVALGRPGVSLASRQKWGERANALEAAGVEFPDSERLAFEQLAAEAKARLPGAEDAKAEAPGPDRPTRAVAGSLFDRVG